MKKTEQYVPRIKNGFPPSRAKTNYPTKIVEGELIRIAERIGHGQYVELSAGSAGKFRNIVHARGLKTIQRRGQGDPIATVYVVTPEWLVANPDV
jgi:hypothetical protein